jgi:hypothetical protein
MRPNQLWVADITHVATWSGFVYVAFVIDVFPGTSLAGGSVYHCTPIWYWMHGSKHYGPGLKQKG